MNWMIRSNTLKLLANGEFAVFDNELRWRFFRENASEGFLVQLPGTPDRLAFLSEADCAMPLYDCPESFKSGFLRAFYGTSLPYSGQLADQDGEEVREASQTDLKWLLFFIGFRAGSQVEAFGNSDLVGARLNAFSATPNANMDLASQNRNADLSSVCANLS